MSIHSEVDHSQANSIRKAINNNECPVKEKHVRRIIIDSFREKGSAFFWNFAVKLPLQENPIVCWKFCHVVHKLLREGHPKAIIDAYPNRRIVGDLGRFWGSLKDGYGKLIQNYCALIVSKMDFHVRNIKFPGSLQVTDEELDEIGERDVNVFFQLSCEMFDYLDEILSLQSSVFGSLDMSRANSMTSAGQCRLAPLIPCIQDSSQLYDYSVKVLFKLHGALPPGTLDGHRDRFLTQFRLLKQFYLNSNNLQYFRYLIQIPLLPENPPNFLLASDLKSHVTPVVILPQQSDSPDGSEATDTLIDLSFPNNQVDKATSDENSSVWSFRSEPVNGSVSHEALEAKDNLIIKLKRRIEELEMEIQQIRIEDGRIIDNFRRKLAEVECNVVESDRALKAINIDKDNLSKENEELKQEIIKLKSGTDIQHENTKANEKLAKVLDIYKKLRDEHIELLRAKAEVDKNCISTKSALERELKAKENLEEQLKDLKHKVEENQVKSETVEKAEAIEAYNKKLLTEIALLQKEKLQTEGELSDVQKHLLMVKADLEDQSRIWESKFNELKWHLLDLLLQETYNISCKLNDEADTGPCSVTVFSTPENFFNQCDNLKDWLEKLSTISQDFTCSPNNLDDISRFIINYYSSLSHTFHCGRVIYQTLPNFDLAQELMNHCKNLVSSSIQLNQKMKNRVDIKDQLEVTNLCVNQIIALRSKIMPQLNLNQNANLEQLLTQELSDMDKAIEEAVSKLEQMMVKSKKQDSGVTLEVNENILDACTTLMQAIVRLVKNSKELQREIIVQGKGSASPSEFYQRNHRWTEGLISAAKVVALAAKLLVEAADKVIAGKAKFEELMVASNEIAAATAQLVVASRVKADRKSVKMSKLSQSSKEVREATGNVVAIAKSCAEKIEETDTMDFSKLTLHQAKKMEMESQVKLLELESEITRERMRLAGLRKRHYHLAS
ncbi:huntingtin-interacting protein 1-like isoform X2 [Panonychus citri]|uniref:huntingtin-interacting protein 1-like isoform X2 n=1 Tax=Panonychus citri TaxID=50023 RepID=UPI0023070A78|nr:huntingtin-interacting protein 1-like isoform X2 [Panonychus citri]